MTKAAQGQQQRMAELLPVGAQVGPELLALGHAARMSGQTEAASGQTRAPALGHAKPARSANHVSPACVAVATIMRVLVHPPVLSMAPPARREQQMGKGVETSPVLATPLPSRCLPAHPCAFDTPCSTHAVLYVTMRCASSGGAPTRDAHMAQSSLLC